MNLSHELEFGSEDSIIIRHHGPAMQDKEILILLIQEGG